MANLRAAIEHAGSALVSVSTGLPAGDLVNLGRAIFSENGPIPLKSVARSVERSLSDEIEQEHGGAAVAAPIIATLSDLLQHHGLSLDVVIEQHDWHEASVAAAIMKDGKHRLIGLDAGQLSLLRKLLEATYRHYLAQKDLLFELARIAIPALLKKTGASEEKIEQFEREFERLATLATPPIPFTIPKPVSYFKGYEEERAAVRAALAGGGAAAISVLHGIGGAGKSELARKVADDMVADFPDGQILVDMLGTTQQPRSPSDAMSIVLLALGEKIDPRTLHADYHSRLRGKRLLVLLDNVASDAGLDELLRPHPPTAFLVTSRTWLALGVQSIELERLSRDAARALLGELAPKLDEATRNTLAELCCDLPLALRVAGAYLAIPGTSAAVFIEELQQRRLTHLSQSAKDRDLPDPLLVLGLSYDRLAETHPAIARSFTLLSVFPAEFDACAAAAVLDLTPAENDRHLAQLTSRSLLQHPSDGRFRLHDLLRDVGRQHALEDNFLNARERHAKFYIQSLKTRTFQFFDRPDIVALNSYFTKEVPNLISASFVQSDTYPLRSIAALQQLAWVSMYASDELGFNIAEFCYSVAVPAMRAIADQDLRLKVYAASILSDHATFLHAVDRPHEALTAIDEAIACYEQLPSPWPDRHIEGLARVHAMRADYLEAAGFELMARKANVNAIRLMQPVFLRRPAEMARMIFTYCVMYRERCAKRGVEPDAGLLGPIEAELAPLRKADPELFASLENGLAMRRKFVGN